MKNLKKALAAVIAMSVVAASNSAFAAVNYTKTLTGGTLDYDAATKTVQATVSSAEVGEQMTFLLLNDGTDVLNIAANNILYIDQKEATSASGGKSFSAPINLARVGNDLSDLPDGTYPVRFGYYDSQGDFQIATGSLVKTTTIDPAITSFTTDSELNTTAGATETVTATIQTVGGASTAYTWAVTTYPAGVTASDVTLEGNSFTANKIGQYVLTATAAFDGSTVTKTVNVTDSAPLLTSASIDGATAAYTDETVTLTGSYVNGGKENVTLSWEVVSGPATVSPATGTTTVVTPSGAGTVVVKLTAEAATGAKQEDTTEITFGPRPVTPPSDPTITIKWGDIDLDGSADATDKMAALYAFAGKEDSWTKEGYTFRFNRAQVTKEAKTYDLKYAGNTIKWGDVDLDGSADATDKMAVLYAFAGKEDTWTAYGNDFEFNKSVVLTLVEVAE